MGKLRFVLRALVALGGVVAMLWGASPAIGQIDILPPLETTTTTAPPDSSSSTSSSSTTIPSPASTTTQPAEGDGDGASSSTTTTSPAGDPSIIPPPGQPPGDGPLPEGLPGDGPKVPGWAEDAISSIERTPASNTSRVLELLKPLEAFGFTPDEIALIGLGRFVVRGEASYVDDWWYPRYVPEFHLHQGTDIFADCGTPVVAPFDGVLTRGKGAVSGLYTYLTVKNGTYFFSGHLQSLVDLPDEQRITNPEEAAQHHFRSNDEPVAYRVKAGQVVGTVGNTGNAVGTPCHVHFEVHPKGGEAVNPKPRLDRWLAAAERKVPEVIAAYTSRGPKAVVATQRTRAGGTGQFAAPERPLSAEILGVSSLSPGTGVRVVHEEVNRAVARIDWKRRSALGRPLEGLSLALTEALAGSGD